MKISTSLSDAVNTQLVGKAAEALASANRAQLQNYLASQPFADTTALNAYTNSNLSLNDSVIIPGDGRYLLTSLSPLTWVRQGDSDGKKSADYSSSSATNAALASSKALEAVTVVGAAGSKIFFGSAQFPIENGMTTIPSDNGEFRLPGFKTGMTGSGTAALWYGTETVIGFAEPAFEVEAGKNHAPCVFSTNGSTTSARQISLRWYTPSNNSATNRRKFHAIVYGESGGGKWEFYSQQLPLTATGPYMWRMRNDGTNAYLDIFDIPTRTWYAGTGVAKPGSWAGVPQITYDLAIGGAPSYTFPQDNSVAPQGALQWRGALGPILFANCALSDANCEAILDGADAVATATGAGSTRHLYIPMVTTAGNINTAVTTNQSGMSAGMTQYGTILPGPNMRRQSTGTYLTIDRQKWPACYAAEFGATAVRVVLTGKMAGLSGRLQIRYAAQTGQLIRDWFEVPYTISGTDWISTFRVPLEELKEWQFQARMTSDVSIVAATHSSCLMGWSVQPTGQSELEIALMAVGGSYGSNAVGTPSALNPTLPFNSETVVFMTHQDGSLTFGGIHMKRAKYKAGYLGDSAVALVTRIRRVTQMPIFIINQAVSGTSNFDLMDDSQSGRLWTDYTSKAALLQNRGARGEYIITGDVYGGWEAYLANGTNPINGLGPWLTGVASGTVTNTATIAQANINHWRFNGEQSQNSKIVVMPCNRLTLARASTTATDADGEADQRDQFRNYAHLYGYEVGPPMETNKLEGENAAGGLLPTVPAGHPEQGDFEGSSEAAYFVADAILMAVGHGAYPGPVFFESIRAGTTSSKLIVKAGNPRPYPGEGLNPAATGYYIDPGDPTPLVHTTATQATSISTPVTCNGDSGVITTFTQTIAAGAEQDFVVNNSKVAAGDVVTCSITAHPSAGAFMASVVAVSAGSFTVRLTNLHATTPGNNTLSIGFSVTPSVPRSLVSRVRIKAAPNPSAVNLVTKKVGGDPGAGFEARKNGGTWSKANVLSDLSVIINPREVELTLAFSYTTGDVIQVRYHPGGLGSYDNAVITQEAWRAGSLFFTGESLPAGTVAEVSLAKLGWAVSGSNQVLSYTA